MKILVQKALTTFILILETVFSGGSRGGSGGSLEPPTPVTETKLFHFLGIFMKNEGNLQIDPYPLCTSEPHFQKFTYRSLSASCSIIIYNAAAVVGPPARFGQLNLILFKNTESSIKSSSSISLENK